MTKRRPISATLEEGAAAAVLLREHQRQRTFAPLERAVRTDPTYRTLWLRQMERRAYRAIRRKAGKGLTADALAARLGDFGMREWLLYDLIRQEEADAQAERRRERARALEQLVHGPSNRDERGTGVRVGSVRVIDRTPAPESDATGAVDAG